MILAVDPGIRGCGAALFEVKSGAGYTLHAAAYVKNPQTTGNGPAECAAVARAVIRWARAAGAPVSTIAALVVEWPQVYQGSKQKGDPGDLLPLAAVDGALAALLQNAEVTRYLPREWKGQAPANVCAGRVLERLTFEESQRIDRCAEFVDALARANFVRKEVGGTDHNTIDAVGIGLKFVGRFEPKKVYG